jgi:ferredoxin
MAKLTYCSFLTIVLVALAAATEAFVVPTPAPSTSSTNLHGMFGGLADAFKNDERLDKPKNAGLSGGPNYNDQVTVNGKPVPGAVVGQKLTVVAARARVKIPVNCQQGDCGTCMVNFNGRKVKACQATLPAGKAAITTL